MSSTLAVSLIGTGSVFVSPSTEGRHCHSLTHLTCYDTAPCATSSGVGHDDTAAHNCSRGGSLPQFQAFDDDNDVVSLSLPAPVLKGARNCGSSRMQELLASDMTGLPAHTCGLWPVSCGYGYGYGHTQKYPTRYLGHCHNALPSGEHCGAFSEEVHVESKLILN